MKNLEVYVGDHFCGTIDIQNLETWYFIDCPQPGAIGSFVRV